MATGDLDLDTARYCYCLVDVGEAGADLDGTALDVAGVEDADPYLVVADGVGVVVHDCDRRYDSEDPAQVRRWLVRHQGVVDAAGERFGTPLPFRFDVAIAGDDDAVRDWVREDLAAAREALADLADHWEYRIHLTWEPPADAFDDDDETLADVEARLAEAGPGKRFLLERKRDQRERELRQSRRADLAADLRSAVEPVVRDVSDQRGEGGLGAGGDGEDPVARLAVLAHADREDALGEALDDIAARPGVQIRFTGPWPPYTFAPSFGEDEP